jgi:apolipoprotein N-acyltransferase
MKNIRLILIGVILSILSGVLLSLSFLQIGLGFFMWFALVPVMIADFKLARNRWQFGIFFGIMVITWLEIYWWVLPVTWIKIAPIFVGIIMVMVASPLKRILEWHNYCLFIPLSAVAGVTIDLLNSFTPTGNISSFATTQSTYPVVIQIASLFGIHSITFLLISNNALISLIIIKFAVLRKYKWQIIGSLTLLFLSLLLGIIHLNYLAEKSIPVAAVQQGTDDSFSKPIDKAALMGARLVVLPECSYLIYNELSFEDYAGTWKSLAARNNIYLIAPYGLCSGIPGMNLEINRNMAVLVSPDGRIGTPYAKHHIVKILGEDCGFA